MTSRNFDSRSSVSLSPFSSDDNDNKYNNNNNKNNNNLFVLPSQAFVPIKELSEQETKVDGKMDGRLKQMERSTEHLGNEMTVLKRQVRGKNDQNNHSEITVYLTKKLQEVHEMVTRMEGRVEEQARDSMEQKGALAALADKVVEVETSMISNNDPQTMAHLSDQVMSHRDSMDDTRKRIGDDQRRNDHKQQQLQQQLQQLQQQLQQLQQELRQNQDQKQNSLTAEALQREEKLSNQIQKQLQKQNLQQQQQENLEQQLNQLQHQQKTQRQQTTTIAPLSDREMNNKMTEVAENVVKKHIPNINNNNKHDDADKKIKELEKKVKEDLKALDTSLRTEVNKLKHTHKEPKNNEQDARTIKAIKDSIHLLADKQIEHYKAMKVKIQTEILTRQQFECDTLRQMADFDEKLIRMRSEDGGEEEEEEEDVSIKSELIVKEVESLKKLLKETEKQLQVKIEDAVQKMKTKDGAEDKKRLLEEESNKASSNSKKDEDAWKEEWMRRENGRMRELSGVVVMVAENKREIEGMDEWRRKCEKEVEGLGGDVGRLKIQKPVKDYADLNDREMEALKRQMKATSQKDYSARNDKDVQELQRNLQSNKEKADQMYLEKISALETSQKDYSARNDKDVQELKRNLHSNKEIQNSLDEYLRRLTSLEDSLKNYKQTNDREIEELKRKIKLFEDKPDATNKLGDYQLKKEAEAVEREVRELKSQVAQIQKPLLPDIRSRIEHESTTRNMEVGELKRKMEDLEKLQQDIKTLSSTILTTRNSLAMKMQFEEKERKIADEHMQTQINEVEKDLDDVMEKMN